ncbi:MAG: flagellar basal body rod protein FlgB [Methylotenera sp.]
MILSQIESITPKLIGFALDGLTMRHQAIASNIANISSADYRPMKVSFEQQISAIRSDFYDNAAKSADVNFKPIVSYGNKQQLSNSSSAGIDMNTVQLNQNVIQYHALIRGLEHYVSTLSIAIKEGRS